MCSDTDQPTQAVPAQTGDEAFHDHIIAQRLPTWLVSASAAQVQALADAMTLSLYFRQRVDEVLGQLQNIDTFARPLLQQAFNTCLESPVPIDDVLFRQGSPEPIINAQPVGSHLTGYAYGTVPLLEAALRNFSREQASAGGQPKGNRLEAVKGQPSLPTAIDFASLCRELDIGGKYQAYLASQLEPVKDTDRLSLAQSLIGRSQRYAMLADSHVALLRGHFTEHEHQVVVDLCGLYTPMPLGGQPVVAKQLALLGTSLEQILVLDLGDRVLVHIPGDALGAWRSFTNLRYFANALGKRLRTPSYQRFFARFVRRRDSQGFFTAVQEAYDGLSDLANASLNERMRALPVALFDALAVSRVDQIKDDAAMVAVPRDQLDAQIQEAHDQRLAAEGWALLNLAGMFVPVIGIGLLAVTAFELLKEVYHGVEAWQAGDTSEALDHLFNVTRDVAQMAAAAAGVSLLRRAWARSAWVDSLVPAQLQDGTTRLWNQDLAPFRSGPPPVEATRDAWGIHRLGEQAWVEMAGHYYPVEEDTVSAQWRLQPRGGHAPQLQHNGAGAWRLWCEQPVEWDDTGYLLRRLGGDYTGLDDEQAEQFLSMHGLDAAQLRGLHVHGPAPDARLSDSVLRFALDRRIRSVIRQLRGGEAVMDMTVLDHVRALPGAEGLGDPLLAELAWGQRRQLMQRVYEAVQVSHGNDVATLRRLFPGLHVGGAMELLRAASALDRQRLVDSGRVSLSLANAARAAAFETRLVRVYEGLFLDVPQNADLAKVVLGLSERLPGGAPRLRLFEGSTQGPLLLAGEQGVGDFDLVHTNGQFQLLNTQGNAVGARGELFEVITSAYGAVQRNALGVGEPFAHNLRILIGRQARQERSVVAQLLGRTEPLGWFRTPRRLSGDRLGYPLSGRNPGGSGRPRPRGLFACVRAIYPTFSDAEVMAWLNDVQHAGLSPHAEVDSLARELQALDSHLLNWSRRTTSIMQRESRQALRQALLDCWQRRGGPAASGHYSTGYRLSLDAVRLDTLPQLPEQVSFAHVHMLSLVGVGLRNTPAGFLQAFARLRVLELSNNQLVRVPGGLRQLTSLRELDLHDNQIVLDTEQAMTLANCESLERINLSHNPLGRTFPLYRLDRLTHLYLRGTGINELPPALLDHVELMVADLRNNQISELPGRFFHAPVWLSSNVLLAENPLNAEAAQRFRVFQAANGLFAEPAGQAHAIVARAAWLQAAGDVPWHAEVWDELQDEPGTGDFFDLLQRLQGSADFQHRPQALASRVFTLMAAMREHASLREELLNGTTEALTCQDSAALRFSDLELRMLVWRASADTGTADQQGALMHLGQQLWRLEEVERIAREDLLARRADGADPDEVEVMLAYRLGLRDSLDLPAQPDDMLYATVASVDAQRLESARVQVLAAETTDRLAAALAQRRFWIDHLARTQAERFEAMNAPYHTRSMALMTLDQSLPWSDYQSRNQALQREWTQARAALVLTLTQAALEAHPDPSTGP